MRSFLNLEPSLQKSTLSDYANLLSFEENVAAPARGWVILYTKQCLTLLH
jgi:hypothetical protein